MIKNVINITHSDLDGVFCAVLTHLAYPLKDFLTPIYYCSYDNINDKVKDIIKNVLPTLKEDVLIYITDISVNDEVAELIESINKKMVEGEHTIYFCLLDHHGNEQAMSLNRYSWATVQPNMIDSNKKTSGTRLYFDELQIELTHTIGPVLMKSLEKFVELVRKYDTWEWAANKEVDPERFNRLLKIYPRKMFVEIFSSINRYSTSEIFNRTETLMLELDEEKKKSYIKNKLLDSCYMTVGGECAIVTMAEQYVSELGNAMCLEYDKAKFSVIIMSKSLSFRSTDGTDVAKVAQLFGGNGHAAAAGAQYSENVKFDLYSDLMYMMKQDVIDKSNEQN